MPWPRRLARFAAFLSVTLAFALFSGRAEARWREAHQTSDDVRIRVGPDGAAQVVHHLRYRVVAGRYEAFEVEGIDPRAVLTTETTVLPEKGGEIAARVERAGDDGDGEVRVVVDAPKGLGRGEYLVDVAYAIDLVATARITRDGAMWRLAWTAPPAPRGRDGARVVFEVPSAPTEPRLASRDDAQTTLVTVRRSAESDEIELVRAHVPRGEAVTWAVRVDPKAMPLVRAPELRPKARPTPATRPKSRVAGALVACALAALAGLFAAALRTKQAAVAAACAGAGATPRPLVPVPFGVGPFVYGAAAAAGLALLLWWVPLWGALLVVLAMLLGTHRAPRTAPKARGPGRWQHAPDSDVLLADGAPSAGDALDLGTRKGRLTALAIAGVVTAAAFALRARVPGAAVAIPLAAAALVPLFVTGTRADLPASPRALGAKILAPARDALAHLVDLAHADVRCLARTGEGARDIDEVRLSCAPKGPIPGLRGIELAAAAANPEVLVRFDDGSEAAAKIARIAEGRPIVVGRTPEEKVLRLAPTGPTPKAAARLLARLLSELEERRTRPRAALTM